METSNQNAEVLRTLKLHIGMGLEGEKSEDNSIDLRERVCQDDFCKFSKFKYLSAEKTPNISCRHIS